ncbi:hypothetical protein PQX77_021596 [Marasmius sp. AFHP31]|nr:hypothetical protein PQX77_021596 [Marasmius sp. AFHP31]
MPLKHKPYGGHVQDLVVAIDVGTTFSGISYAILKPNTVPEIKAVTRYPKQEYAGSDAKIPTVLYYDKRGRVQAVGAETQTGENVEKAQARGWVQARWFKLHLHPCNHVTGGDANQPKNFSELPPLPPNKTAEDVLADFLGYMYGCLKKYIGETVADKSFWAEVEDRVQLVLSHPNCWGGEEQSMLREACIRGGLVPNTFEGKNRVNFVTEGEACLHFCINETLSKIQSPDGVRNMMIVDAGGGTVDISTYLVQLGRARRINETSSFQEITVPESRFAGSVFVTEEAKTYFRDFMAGSQYENDVDRITKAFDRSAKLLFSNDTTSSFIDFGRLIDNDDTLNIRGGVLKLPGNKVTADGAVSYHLHSMVTARVARYTYGAPCSFVYDQNDREHVQRKAAARDWHSGLTCIPNGFALLVAKGRRVAENQSYQHTFHDEALHRDEFEKTIAKFMVYKGEMAEPKWMDVDSVEADTSQMSEALVLHRQPDGSESYELKYNVEIYLGATELKAQISWEDKGVKKRCPAQVVYEKDLDSVGESTGEPPARKRRKTLRD